MPDYNSHIYQIVKIDETGIVPSSISEMGAAFPHLNFAVDYRDVQSWAHPRLHTGGMFGVCWHSPAPTVGDFENAEQGLNVTFDGQVHTAPNASCINGDYITTWDAVPMSQDEIDDKKQVAKTAKFGRVENLIYALYIKRNKIADSSLQSDIDKVAIIDATVGALNTAKADIDASPYPYDSVEIPDVTGLI